MHCKNTRPYPDLILSSLGVSQSTRSICCDGQQKALCRPRYEGTLMQRINLESFSTDELWELHRRLARILVAKLTGEINAIEDRLGQLGGRIQIKRLRKKQSRRQYPTVVPKFRNPNQPSQTWAGRGKRPRWLTAYRKSGKRIDDFRIKQAAA